jgi:hypothetical protein
MHTQTQRVMQNGEGWRGVAVVSARAHDVIMGLAVLVNNLHPVRQLKSETEAISGRAVAIHCSNSAAATRKAASGGASAAAAAVTDAAAAAATAAVAATAATPASPPRPHLRNR